MSVRREITVTRKGLIRPIDIVQGTDLIPFEFVVTDFTIPLGAAAVAYNKTGSGTTRKQICDVIDNTITFTPDSSLFDEGKNVLQLRVTHEEKNLFSFEIIVNSSKAPETDDAEEVEKQSTLVTQLLTKIGNLFKAVADETTERKNADAAEESARKQADAKEKAERQAEIAVERARIDNLARMEEGSTTGDAELMDIRVGVDGQNYNSAGEAVRSAGGFAKTLPIGKNLLKRDTDTVGYNLTETGELSANANYEVTNFIPVAAGEPYVLSDNGVGGIFTRTICYYDVNKNVIGYAAYIRVYPITMPENTKYVRFSFENNLVYPQFEQNTVATEYEAFSGANLIDGNSLYIHSKSLDPEKMSFFGTKASGKNLLDRTKSTVGYVLTATGELSSNPKAETSDYIAVAYGDNLYMSGKPEEGYTTVIIGYAFYDENKNLVSVVERMALGGQNPLPIPRNIKYVRYSYRMYGTKIQIERGTEATEYEEFVGIPCLKSEYLNFKQPNDLNYTENPWFGKRLVVDGDSITHDQGKYNYWQFVAAQLTDMYVDNSDITTEYANGWKGVGGSRIANELGANDPKYSIVLRYMNLPDDAELVMIAGGTNDWAHDNVLLGDFDSTDNTTFNGALNVLLPGLKEKYPTIPVVMMTPIKRGTYGQLNNNGNTQEEFVEALIKKCRQYNVYCLDMWSNCPINPNIESMAVALYQKEDGTNDYTHPNTKGHEVMGKTVAGFIRTLT